MSEGNDQDAGKSRLSLRPTGRTEVGRTVDAGSVRQSFSHGRTKAVVVEKKRSLGAPPKASEKPAPAPEKPAAVPQPAAAKAALAKNKKLEDSADDADGADTEADDDALEDTDDLADETDDIEVAVEDDKNEGDR